MAKDPAFLFYPGDWQGGTATFSRFLKGCYMDILIAQFNNGPLSLEEIKTVLGSDFGTAWPTLQKKFKQSAGLFFNEKLATEVEKRKAFSESRRQNVKNRYKEKPTLEPTYVEDMNTHMENESEDEKENVNDQGGAGGMNLGLEENLNEIRNSHTLKADYMKNHKYSEATYMEMLDDFGKMCREKEYDGSLRETKLYLSNFNKVWKTNKSKEKNGQSKHAANNDALDGRIANAATGAKY